MDDPAPSPGPSSDPVEKRYKINTGDHSIVVIESNITAPLVEIHENSAPITKYNLCPCPPNLFTGRYEFLENLHTSISITLKKSTGPTPHAHAHRHLTIITGLGGIGKSCVAKKYAEVYQNVYKNVAWIDAETRGSCLQSFVRVAEFCKIAPDFLAQYHREGGGQLKNMDQLVTTVYNHFSDHVHQGLFILDNVQQQDAAMAGVKRKIDPATPKDDDQIGIWSILPKTGLTNYPTFLLTSRHRQWGHGIPEYEIEVIPLEKFESIESLTYLKRAFDLTPPSIAMETEEEDDNVKKLKNLSSKLDGYPLALSLAAAAIRESFECTGDLEMELDIYMDEFDTKADEWVGKDWPYEEYNGDYDMIIATVWQATMDRIKGQAIKRPEYKLAINLMDTMSYLETNRISVKLLHFVESNIDINVDTMLQFKMREARGTCMALGILEKYSMISVQKVGPLAPVDVTSYYGEHDFFFSDGCGRIDVHRLVQKWNRVIICTHENSFESLTHLATYVQTNVDYFILTEIAQSILNRLKDHQWPLQSHRQYLAIGLYDRRDIGLKSMDSTTILKDVYDHFWALKETRSQSDVDVHVTRDEWDEEYFNFTRMLLVLKQISNHNSMKRHAPPPPPPSHLLDNSKFLSQTDPLCHVQIDHFLNWTVDQATTYLDNHWLQAFSNLVCVLMLVESVTRRKLIRVPSQETIDKILNWIRTFTQSIYSISPNFVQKRKDDDDYLQSACEDIFKISSPFLDVQESTHILRRTMTCPWANNLECFNCWNYFDSTVWYIDQLPREVWENFSSCSLELQEEALQTCRLLVNPDHGLLKNLTEWLTAFERIYRKDAGLRILWRESQKGLPKHLKGTEKRKKTDRLLQTFHIFRLIQVLAHFEECAKIILQSFEFIMSLRIVLTLMVEGVDKQVYHLPDLHDILLAWFALFSHPWSSEMVTTCEDLTDKELKTCQRIFKNQKKVVKKHGGAYEQLRTRRRPIILKKYCDLLGHSGTSTSKWLKLAQDFQQFGEALDGAHTAYFNVPVPAGTAVPVNQWDDDEAVLDFEIFDF